MNSPIVVNKYKEPYDVYIGRGSLWGNPYIICENLTRDQVIIAYKHWLWSQMKSGAITEGDIRGLGGKRLGCFCKPKACHGDVLVKAYEWLHRTGGRDFYNKVKQEDA